MDSQSISERKTQIIEATVRAIIKFGYYSFSMQDVAKLEQHEMYRTFNMGIGMVLIVSKEEVTKVRALSTLPVYEIGEVVASDDGNERVILR